MNRILFYFLIAIFSIFLGSQIVEGLLILPHWKSLSPTAFYQYYAQFGPSLGRFYSMLTIIAVLIPICTCIYCIVNKKKGLTLSILSSVFAILVVLVFYVYFKGTNLQFYASAFNADQLKSVLETWGRWHWVRIIFEILSLVFLILAFHLLDSEHSENHAVGT